MVDEFGTMYLSVHMYDYINFSNQAQQILIDATDRFAYIFRCHNSYYAKLGKYEKDFLRLVIRKNTETRD